MNRKPRNKMNRNTTPKITPSQGSLSRRLAKHFAVLAIPAALVPAAQAQIIWSGPVNINVPSNIDGVYLNVLTGVTGITGGAVPGWDVNPYSTGPGLAFWSPNTTTGGFVSSLGATTAIDNLAPGTLIDGSLGYNRLSVETTGTTTFNVSSIQNLAGFRFVNEGNSLVHYGWLRVSLTDTLGSQPRSIVEYAYESTPGLGIGAGVIPEPAAASLLLLGLGGLLGFRASRRQ
jgi:hypothetical protein